MKQRKTILIQEMVEVGFDLYRSIKFANWEAKEKGFKFPTPHMEDACRKWADLMPRFYAKVKK